VAGRDVFVDPGTFDYFTYPEWRKYFRSTAAHNTAEIDGEDQSAMLGPFLWGDRAVSRCTRFETKGAGGIVSGEHDGYARLSPPARHSRTIDMDAESGSVIVTDEFLSKGAHHLRILFHVAEISTHGRSITGPDRGGPSVLCSMWIRRSQSHWHTDPKTPSQVGQPAITGNPLRDHHRCGTQGNTRFRFHIRRGWACLVRFHLLCLKGRDGMYVEARQSPSAWSFRGTFDGRTGDPGLCRLAFWVPRGFFTFLTRV
jgi:hypothetical protein